MRRIVFAAALLAAVPTAASDLTPQLRVCAALSSQAERIQCYDELAAGLPDEQQDRPAPAPPQPAAAPVAETPNSPATGVQSTPIVEPEPAPPRVATQTAQPDPDDRFGIEHHESQRTTADSISAHISSIDKTVYGNLVIHLDNGQTWQQRGYKRYPLKQGDEIIITRGALNSFFFSSTRSNRKERFFRID
ncbi:MAG: hypothetical protein E2O54_04985 [Gammaproteobacteria bacterium]|nr:MAG: hypothetical protein E2O54_04985 [Gammaproteobacteria bacterium]